MRQNETQAKEKRSSVVIEATETPDTELRATIEDFIPRRFNDDSTPLFN